MLWFIVLSDQQVEVKVEEGSESVILPCRTPDLPEDTRVDWTRSDLGLLVVHEYSSKSGQFMTQDDFYRERTKVNEDLLRIGDLSLTLKQPTGKDTGRYICTIYRDKDILRQKVVLQVKGQRWRYRSKVSAVDVHQRSKVMSFYVFLHRTISILGQSSPGSPGSSSGFWRSFILFSSLLHVR
uniref:Ig-like domain-containing protein n=1 Tax=Amphilophus citrinellus TaxID=61819 RepID=A0A3Q0R745_AMPCI